MKKMLLVIWFICLFVLGCNCSLLKNESYIIDKGIDKIDITAMMEGLQIKTTDADEKFQELYWLKIRGMDHKVYINQFSYEISEIGGFIKLGADTVDLRFSNEY